MITRIGGRKKRPLFPAGTLFLAFHDDVGALHFALKKLRDCDYVNQEVYTHVTYHLIVVRGAAHAADGVPHFGTVAVLPHC